MKNISRNKKYKSKKCKIIYKKNTLSSNSFRNFSAPVQVERMPFVKSISCRHFSLMLKMVLGIRVPLSSSLIAFIILEIFNGGTFASHKMFINCLSLSDKSFCNSNVASSSRGGGL
jgi:hypothetical protein